ncbi:hypothetical protein BG005_004645 [Podila minutissima]|nr:hypothetical protein BG005_004645 [Podila minutissima]
MSNVIKITLQDDGKKHERIFEFAPGATCRLAVEQCRYSKKHGGWIHDDTRLMDIVFKGHKALEMKTKTPSYFETLPIPLLEPSRASLRDSALLKGPSSPLDHHRIFNFMFRSSDDHFVSKFQRRGIYLSVILVNSDNKILLSSSGVPPTVMISTVELANNYYAFDTESPDFTWMFKTTLDWAAEIPPSSVTRTETVESPRQSMDSCNRPRALTSMSPPLPGRRQGGASVTPMIFSPAPTKSPNTSATVSNQSSMSSVSNISIISNGGQRRPAVRTLSNASAEFSSGTRPAYEYRDRTLDYRRENSLRQEYVAAVSLLQKRLGIPPIHLLYDKVLDLPQVGAKNVIAIQYIKDSDKDQLSPEVLHMGNFRWKSIDGVSSSIYTKKEDIWNCLTSYYDSVRVSRPSPGLYVGLYYTESTMSGMQILVPSQRRSLVPVVKLRNESSLLSAEWDWIRSTASMDTTTLAKKCAVSKDDPLHHLKVEFAHATAKLAKMTKLKWDPSDIYTLDTMKIFLRTSPDSARSAQERQSQNINRDGGHGAQKVLSDSLLPSNIPSLGLEAPSNQERLAAMDLDPVWRGQDFGQESKNGKQDEDTIRVIMFIKPTRHASQPQERFNTKQFELSSFPLFDAIHHSVFNTATYHRLRKTMHELSNEIEDLECELEMNMERDREGKGSKDMPISEQMSKGNKYSGGIVEDDISSLLINELGIKGEGDMDTRSRSPRTLSRSHSINRNSFVSDNALHGPRSSRQSSMYSLLESFEKSGPSVGPVMSIATSYASATSYPSATSYTSCSENIPQAQGNGSLSHSISRQSLLEAAKDRELPDLPPGAEVKPENESSSASSAEPARAELMRHRSSNGSLSSHSRSVSLASSLKALPLRSSYYGQSYTAAINGHQHPPQQNLHQQQVQQQHQRTESLSLANVAFPRHQRSYSHIQAEIGPQPTNVSLKSRTRTTSQSSSVLQQQQHPTPGPNLQSPTQLHLANGTTSNVAPKLERLEQQQQQIQQQWRMVSWTRQLNEWDHARMLKSQEQLLGFASTGPSSMASSQPLPELPTTISL